MQHLNWSDFQAFLAIAQSGQLAAAARSMGIDATTIGRRLRRLERTLGQTLFEQTREGQVLTEAGEQLLASVEKMASAASRITVRNSDEKGPTGTLRISVSEGFGTRFLAPRLPDFTEKYPRLVVDLVASNSYLSLSKREADIAIFLSRPKAGPLVAKRLTQYALGLYASPKYLDSHGTPQSATDLSEHRLIGYIPDLLFAPELRYLHEILPDVSVALRSSSINAQSALIASGGGIGVLPCFIGDTTAGMLRILPAHTIIRNFWLVMHKDTHQLEKIRVFNDWLTNLVVEKNALLRGDSF